MLPALAAFVVGQTTISKVAPVALTDLFGRDLSGMGVTLVDWEGRIANPAIKLRLVPGPKLYLPARVRLTATNSRAMFDLWSEVGPNGPQKTIYLDNRTKPATFLMSMFPDTDGAEETFTLRAEITDANESTSVLEFPVHVIEQDQPERQTEFTATADFSHDRSGFFDNPKARLIAQTALQDWVYFLEASPFDPVPAGAERTFVFGTKGFDSGEEVTNSTYYDGFLLYFVGTTGPEKRSGAVASDRGLVQTIKGKKTGLKRSGNVAMETTGNWNGKGWLFFNPDDSWWEAGNMSRMMNDFYSIVHHEMGHSLVNHRVHPAYASKISGGKFIDPTVRRYLGSTDPGILEVEHFSETIDPVSRVGVFGNEYGGDMPRKRWLITKFDLLVMQSCGYRLRDTSPFARLNFEVPTAPVRLDLGTAVDLRLNPTGGIPTYYFKITEGRLPAGLEINSWTGKISGKPKVQGETSITISLRDNDPTRSPVVKVLKLNVVSAQSSSSPRP